MPLNENEERILAEIERQFRVGDPEYTERISRTTLKGYLLRNVKWAALGFFVGLAILLSAFAVSWILGVVGFLIMLASAMVLIQNLHKFSRLGLEQMSQSIGNRNLGQAVEEFGQRLRRRLGHDED